MKKLFILTILSSSIVFGVTTPVATVVEATKAVVTTQTTTKRQIASAITSIFTASLDQIKEHYAIAGSAVITAGVVTLYYTNAEFRALVKAWLGLETKAKK